MKVFWIPAVAALLALATQAPAAAPAEAGARVPQAMVTPVHVVKKKHRTVTRKTTTTRRVVHHRTNTASSTASNGANGANSASSK